MAERSERDVVEAHEGVRELVRLERLSDSVFAMVMVAMVVFVDRPEDRHLTGAGVLRYLRDETETLLLIPTTFLVVGAYWFSQTRQSAHLRKTDTVHTWMHLAFLAMLVMLPFTNALSIITSNAPFAQLVFSVNVVLMGLIALSGWVYASVNGRLLRQGVTKQTIRRTRRELVVEPALALLSIPALALHSFLWNLSFVLVPITMVALTISNGKATRRS